MSVRWVKSNTGAPSLPDEAVVAGYEPCEASPLVVIRAWLDGDLVPGKLIVNRGQAYVPWDFEEQAVEEFEVCCAPQDVIRWCPSQLGHLAPNAVVAGKTADNENLYAGRACHDGVWTPGKIHPSHRLLYLSYDGREISYSGYEVLCTL